MTNIAVIDVGKTNAKLALVDAATLSEIAVITRPNAVLTDGAYPHFDVDGHWAFFLDGLTRFHAEHGVDAISVTTHGASAVLLAADGSLAAPVLDYEHDGPDTVAADYDAIRPDFSETGSPRLAVGLNVGAQLHWQFKTDAGLLGRTAHIVTYPQYWGFRLTGALATDVTSLGCHTDLWNPYERTFSSLVDRLGIAGKIAPARRSDEVLGTLLPQVAAQTGIPQDTPVLCGIHDSNASLYPYLRGLPQPFSVVSTGTWVIAMAMGGQAVKLDAAQDTLINVNALGDPVPSARFMGGREYDLIKGENAQNAEAADMDLVIASGAMLLPAVVGNSGPFTGRTARWIDEPAEGTGERAAAVGFYLALMTAHCLGLIGHQGTVVVEGPFAKNMAYLRMLAAATGSPVIRKTSATGTSAGAALLANRDAAVDKPSAPIPPLVNAATYIARWRAEVAKG